MIQKNHFSSVDPRLSISNWPSWHGYMAGDTNIIFWFIIVKSFIFSLHAGELSIKKFFSVFFLSTWSCSDNRLMKLNHQIKVKVRQNFTTHFTTFNKDISVFHITLINRLLKGFATIFKLGHLDNRQCPCAFWSQNQLSNFAS